MMKYSVDQKRLTGRAAAARAWGTAGVDSLRQELINLPGLNHDGFKHLKERAGLLRGKNSSREAFTNWKDKLNASYSSISESSKSALGTVLIRIESRCLLTMNDLDDAMAELKSLSQQAPAGAERLGHPPHAVSDRTEGVHGDFYLKLLDKARGGVRRYNIIQRGQRHAQAADARRL